MKINFSATGHTKEDILEALLEAVRLVEEDFTSGMNRNDTGSYNFELEGDSVVTYTFLKDADTQEITDERFTNFYEAQDSNPNAFDIVGLDENENVISLT